MTGNPSYAKCYPFEAGSGQQAGQAEWRHLAGAWGDGIVNDFGGGGYSAFDVKGKSTSDRTFAIKLGEYRLRGVHFEATQDDLTLTVPAIANQRVRIDRVVMRYDPTDRSIQCVVKPGVDVAAGSTPAVPALTRMPGGVWEDPLWRIQGGVGAAGTLTFTNERHCLGWLLFAASKDSLLEADTSFPNGTRLLEDATNTEWRLSYPGGLTQWRNLDQPDWNSLTLANLTPALTGRDGPPQTRLRRGNTELQGGIAAMSSNVPAGVTLFTLPPGMRPPVTKRFPVASSAATPAVLEVRPDGTARLSTTPPPCTWFNLDGVPPFQAINN